MSLGSVDTVYSADSIEFSPVSPEIFVCGTYQLQQTKSEVVEEAGGEEPAPSPAARRLGRVLVYETGASGL